MTCILKFVYYQQNNWQAKNWKKSNNNNYLLYLLLLHQFCTSTFNQSVKNVLKQFVTFGWHLTNVTLFKTVRLILFQFSASSRDVLYKKASWTNQDYETHEFCKTFAFFKNFSSPQPVCQSCSELGYMLFISVFYYFSV